MATTDLKTLRKRTQKLIDQVEKEFLEAGMDITSKDFQDFADKIRDSVLEEHGVSLEEFEENSSEEK